MGMVCKCFRLRTNFFPLSVDIVASYSQQKKGIQWNLWEAYNVKSISESMRGIRCQIYLRIKLARNMKNDRTWIWLGTWKPLKHEESLLLVINKCDERTFCFPHPHGESLKKKWSNNKNTFQAFESLVLVDPSISCSSPETSLD